MRNETPKICTAVCGSLHKFHKDFCAFPRREALLFIPARETAWDWEGKRL